MRILFCIASKVVKWHYGNLHWKIRCYHLGQIHSKLIQGILGETNSLKLDRYDIKIDSFQLKQPEILYNSLYINDVKSFPETSWPCHMVQINALYARIELY